MFKLYNITVIFYPDKTSIYQKFIQQNKALFNQDFILNLIIGIIIIFIKEKLVKEKIKGIIFVNKRQYEKIGYLGIKNESHKILNSNGLHKLKVNRNNLLKMQEKNRKYNIKKIILKKMI